MTETLFVTGSGTDIGKTLVTAALAHQAQASGRKVAVIKPVASGYSWDTAAQSDAGVILQALGEEITPENIERVSPWRYRQPVSPDFAARQEGWSVSAIEIAAFCRAAEHGADTVIVEGVGGIMAPINERQTFLDVLPDLPYPALVVIGTYLGALSHAFTCVETLRGRGHRVAGLVVSESVAGQPVAEIARSLAIFLPDLPVVILPRLQEPHPWACAPALTQFLVEKSSSCVAENASHEI